MDEQQHRALERRIDAIEASLAGGRELQAMRDRSALAALQGIEAEQRQIWGLLEKQGERFEAMLKDQRAAFDATVKELRDRQWNIIAWAAALLATQVLGLLLRKFGVA
jgi:hypothetical protein